jgi:pyruvate dehydrogenase E2 component (dihydrolipoamide acetyltransferase)
MDEVNDLLMPKLGLTMTEGTLSEWAVSPGDHVGTGDAIFTVETDKTATEVTAEDEGELRKILVQAGETVAVGTVVAHWTGPSQGAPENSALDEGQQDAKEPTPAPTFEWPASQEPRGNAGEPALESKSESTSNPAERVIATPLARRLAREHDICLRPIGGSGPGGRIKAADVRTALQAALTPEKKASRSPSKGSVQAATARRMVEAKQQIPHFYLTAEAEITELLDLRGRLNSDEGWDKLTINHFVLTAVVRALEMTPEQNRIVVNDEFHELQRIDVGMAVNTEEGLIAPVLKNLGGRSMDEIATSARQLQRRIRKDKARHTDMEGGAITVSNAGMFNVTYMTPIINPPQSAILGVGSIREVFRPDTEAKPELRREVGLVLAADHRLHDGVSGLKFLNRVIDLLQNPLQLMRTQTSRRGI